MNITTSNIMFAVIATLLAIALICLCFRLYELFILKKKAQNQVCADTLPSIYIIGSLSQANQIKKVADSIKDVDVRYVQPEPAKTFSECVSTCFDNIEWADSIYAVLKPDGTVGQGVTYELEYAKRLNKEIQYISEV